MLAETVVAMFLLICLVFFFSVNLHNILKKNQLTQDDKTYADTKRPAVSIIALAAFGTIFYFVDLLLYLFLIFTGLTSALYRFAFLFPLPFILHLQILGSVLTAVGYFLFIWSVIVRGRYAVSWEMPKNQRLVTRGPYHYIRHPSYSGYFLMFLGLFLLWPNLLTIFPLVAIPGYYRVTFDEERLLVERFGDEYIKYQKKTGRFLPKFQ